MTILVEEIAESNYLRGHRVCSILEKILMEVLSAYVPQFNESNPDQVKSDQDFNQFCQAQGIGLNRRGGNAAAGLKGPELKECFAKYQLSVFYDQFPFLTKLTHISDAVQEVAATMFSQKFSAGENFGLASEAASILERLISTIINVATVANYVSGATTDTARVVNIAYLLYRVLTDEPLSKPWRILFEEACISYINGGDRELIQAAVKFGEAAKQADTADKKWACLTFQTYLYQEKLGQPETAIEIYKQITALTGELRNTTKFKFLAFNPYYAIAKIYYDYFESIYKHLITQKGVNQYEFKLLQINLSRLVQLYANLALEELVKFQSFPSRLGNDGTCSHQIDAMILREVEKFTAPPTQQQQGRNTDHQGDSAQGHTNTAGQHSLQEQPGSVESNRVANQLSSALPLIEEQKTEVMRMLLTMGIVDRSIAEHVPCCFIIVGSSFIDPRLEDLLELKDEQGDILLIRETDIIDSLGIFPEYKIRRNIVIFHKYKNNFYITHCDPGNEEINKRYFSTFTRKKTCIKDEHLKTIISAFYKSSSPDQMPLVLNGEDAFTCKQVAMAVLGRDFLVSSYSAQHFSKELAINSKMPVKYNALINTIKRKEVGYISDHISLLTLENLIKYSDKRYTSPVQKLMRLSRFDYNTGKETPSLFSAAAISERGNLADIKKIYDAEKFGIPEYSEVKSDYFLMMFLHEKHYGSVTIYQRQFLKQIIKAAEAIQSEAIFPTSLGQFKLSVAEQLYRHAKKYIIEHNFDVDFFSQDSELNELYDSLHNKLSAINKHIHHDSLSSMSNQDSLTEYRKSAGRGYFAFWGDKKTELRYGGGHLVREHSSFFSYAGILATAYVVSRVLFRPSGN